jgi:hypothetical protein
MARNSTRPGSDPPLQAGCRGRGVIGLAAPEFRPRSPLLAARPNRGRIHAPSFQASSDCRRRPKWAVAVPSASFSRLSSVMRRKTSRALPRRFACSDASLPLLRQSRPARGGLTQPQTDTLCSCAGAFWRRGAGAGETAPVYLSTGREGVCLGPWSRLGWPLRSSPRSPPCWTTREKSAGASSTPDVQGLTENRRPVLGPHFPSIDR